MPPHTRTPQTHIAHTAHHTHHRNAHTTIARTHHPDTDMDTRANTFQTQTLIQTQAQTPHTHMHTHTHTYPPHTHTHIQTSLYPNLASLVLNHVNIGLQPWGSWLHYFSVHHWVVDPTETFQSRSELLGQGLQIWKDWLQRCHVFKPAVQLFQSGQVPLPPFPPPPQREHPPHHSRKKRGKCLLSMDAPCQSVLLKRTLSRWDKIVQVRRLKLEKVVSRCVSPVLHNVHTTGLFTQTRGGVQNIVLSTK